MRCAINSGGAMTFHQTIWAGSVRVGVISLVLSLGFACTEQPLAPGASPDFARSSASPSCSVVVTGTADDLRVNKRKVQATGDVRLVCAGSGRSAETFGGRGTAQVQGIVIIGDPAGIVIIGDPAGLRAGRMSADVVGVVVPEEAEEGFAAAVLEGSDDEYATLIAVLIKEYGAGIVRFGQARLAGYKGSLEALADGTWRIDGTAILIDFTGAG